MKYKPLLNAYFFILSVTTIPATELVSQRVPGNVFPVYLIYFLKPVSIA